MVSNTAFPRKKQKELASTSHLGICFPSFYSYFKDVLENSKVLEITIITIVAPITKLNNKKFLLTIFFYFMLILYIVQEKQRKDLEKPQFDLNSLHSLFLTFQLLPIEFLALAIIPYLLATNSYSQLSFLLSTTVIFPAIFLFLP